MVEKSMLKFPKMMVEVEEEILVTEVVLIEVVLIEVSEVTAIAAATTVEVPKEALEMTNPKEKVEVQQTKLLKPQKTEEVEEVKALC
jgi:hypothetical protein